ncbi:MAG TPA: DUF3035 domain-containing protein [Acetobacteraceae bacterium]|jgi:hypothetical protein|nr:DUF3035 domain-containing protein [Acetobacteraceae bacterium]
MQDVSPYLDHFVAIRRGARRGVFVAVGTVALAGALGGCSGDDITRSFGLVREAPDEFQVTTRAPLSMPPDFTIRPPRPGAPRPQEQSTATAAESTLVPQAALTASEAGVTPGQSALVSEAGPPAPTDIRRKVEAEASLDQPDRSLTNRLMFWKSAPPPGITVDANREAQRIRQNAALGQPLDQGDTPIIQRKSSGGGFLSSIF